MVKQLIVYGLIYGGIISLGAIGLTLIFRILRFGHFAHGDMMTLGAYLALFFKATAGWPMWAAALASLVITPMAAVLIDRLLYKPLRRTTPAILLIASVGMALFLRHLVQFIWGAQVQVYNPGIERPLLIWGVRIRPSQIWIIVMAVVLVFLVWVFLQKTKFGKAMRAMADNMDLAAVSGIDTERMITWTWVLGAVLAAAAGIMLGIDTQLRPVMGWIMLLPLFAATILGGVGNPYGAIAGGMIIGMSPELSTKYITTAYKPPGALVRVVLLLPVRAQGLFGAKGA
ncbi:MAG: amino acid ABC transporter permease [Bacillota bacterium]|nr:MAG: amino acid ABC transporter permease [Bacillota bacterium]